MFNIFGESYEVSIEIYIEDKLVNKQQMEAPKEMLMINFIQNAQRFSNDIRPIKMVMIRPELFWDKFENKERIFNHEVAFSNNARIAWEGNR